LAAFVLGPASDGDEALLDWADGGSDTTRWEALKRFFFDFHHFALLTSFSGEVGACEASFIDHSESGSSSGGAAGCFSFLNHLFFGLL
jgi:hypothetical protein